MTLSLEVAGKMSVAIINGPFKSNQTVRKHLSLYELASRILPVYKSLFKVDLLLGELTWNSPIDLSNEIKSNIPFRILIQLKCVLKISPRDS